MVSAAVAVVWGSPPELAGQSGTATLTGHLSEHPYPAEEEAIREMRRYTTVLNPIGHGEWRARVEGRQQLRGRIRRSYVDRARPHVIEVLDEAGREAPDSDFLVGHRVGYRIKEGREEEALEVARACQASRWWCLALEGFALHQLRRTAEADSVFRASLEAMPLAHLRCTFLDLSPFMWPGMGGPGPPWPDGMDLEHYSGMPCPGEREEIDRTIWWLADPLWARPGNDRWTEHMVRRVAHWLHEEDIALTSTTGCPMHEHGRYAISVGWRPGYWWQRADGGYAAWAARILGYEYGNRPYGPLGGYTFLPDARLARAPLAAEPDDWDLDEWRMGRARVHRVRYDPYYAPFHELEEYQTAAFLRGDSVRVVGAVDVTGTELEAHAPLRAALALDRSPEREPVIAWASDPGAHEPEGQGAQPRGGEGGSPAASAAPAAPPEAPRTRFVTDAVMEARRHLASLEVMGEEGGAGRVRKGLAPPDLTEEGTGASDLLLFRWAREFDEGAPLDEVIPHALGALQVSAEASPLGVYWETYGLEPGEEVEVRVRVTEGDPGTLRRLGRRLRIADEARALEVSWTAQVEEDALETAPHDHPDPPFTLWPRNLSLDLSHLDPGDYRLRITVEPEEREALEMERELRVVEGQASSTGQEDD